MSGIVSGTETQINTYTLGTPGSQQTAVLADGGWVVTWTSDGQDGDGLGIYQQAYNSDGTTAGVETQVNTYTSSGQHQLQMVALSGGGWVVIWKSSGQDGDAGGVYQQAYNSDGTTNGNEIQVNTTTAYDQFYPALAALSDGGWVVTWHDGLSGRIFQQAYDADGSTRGTETVVSSSSVPSGTTLTGLTGGGWVVTYTYADSDGASDVYQQAYNADGSVLGAETRVNSYVTGQQSGETVSALADGGWVVIWMSNGADGDSFGIMQQVYNADGSARGAETPVNTYTTGDQSDAQVTALADGGWVVTWNSYGQDSGQDVFQQVFNADGSVRGGEVEVNTHTQGDQYFPEVVALSDGGWVVVWQDFGSDGGIRQQAYNADGTKHGVEYAVHSDTAGFTVSALPDGGWVVVVGNYDLDTSIVSLVQRVFHFGNNPVTLQKPILDQSFLQGDPLSFQIDSKAFVDIDLDPLTYTATLGDGSALPSWLHFDAATHTFSATTDDSAVGTISIKVTASDGATSASDTFDLTIENINDAPTVAHAIANQNASEDSAFTFTISGTAFDDVDSDSGDTLTYSARRGDDGSLPAWLSFDPATRTFSGTPAANNVGTISVKVIATDKAGLSVSDTFDIVVAHVNHAPVATAVYLPDQQATEDGYFSFIVPSDAFSDVDAMDTLSYSATLANGDALPGWLHFDAASRTFSGTPDNDAVGIVSIKVTVSDGAATTWQTFELDIANTNDAPTLSHSIGQQTVSQDASFSLDAGIAFADVDVGDTMTFAASLAGGKALPSWLQFDTELGIFTGTPSNADVGTIAVSVTATDTSGASVSDTFDIVVDNINDAPKGASKTVTIKEDSSYAFKAADFGFTDAKGEAGHLSGIKITALPGSGKFTLDGVAVHKNDVISASDFSHLVWTPAANANGKDLAHFSFKVIDDGGTANGGKDTALTANVFTFNVTEVTDIFTGTKKADKLVGTADHDILDGKAGNDKLTGLEGSDTFIFGKGYGKDTLIDFVATGKDHDIADLSRLSAVENWKDLKANHLSEHGHDVWIDGGKGDVLVLKGVDIHDLGKGDFLF